MLIAIGDIHGEVWKLRDLLTRLSELPLEDSDRLIFLGDYVDRGPDVNLTIDLLIRTREERPNTVFLRGNHDQTMLDVRDLLDPSRESDVPFEDVAWWFKFGGRETIRSYGGASDWYRRVSGDHWHFLEATELEHREGGYVFVHAGLLPPKVRWFQGVDPRLWVRDEFVTSSADFGGVVVFGHTVMKDGLPLVQANKIGIDTGVAYGGFLTAALLTPDDPEAVRFIQV